MTEEANGLDKTKTVERARTIGAGRESENHRVWVSDLNLRYEFEIEPEDCRMTFLDFYDPRIGRE